MSPRRYAVVVAVTNEWGIGQDGKLPWHPRRLHLDMAFLKYITTHNYNLTPSDQDVEFEDNSITTPSEMDTNIIIMGRKTWESLPPKLKPMDGRFNVIVTSKPEELQSHPAYGQKLLAVQTFTKAIEVGLSRPGRTFVLGGSSIYEAALHDPQCEAIFITRLYQHPSLPCNINFPRSIMLEHWVHTKNITKIVWDLLKTTLSKSSLAILDPDEQVVREDDITYSIELWTRNKVN